MTSSPVVSTSGLTTVFANVIVLPGQASAMASRKLPAPLSPFVVTTGLLMQIESMSVALLLPGVVSRHATRRGDRRRIGKGSGRGGTEIRRDGVSHRAACGQIHRIVDVAGAGSRAGSSARADTRPGGPM